MRGILSAILAPPRMAGKRDQAGVDGKCGQSGAGSVPVRGVEQGPFDLCQDRWDGRIGFTRDGCLLWRGRWQRLAVGSGFRLIFFV